MGQDIAREIPPARLGVEIAFGDQLGVGRLDGDHAHAEIAREGAFRRQLLVGLYRARFHIGSDVLVEGDVEGVFAARGEVVGEHSGPIVKKTGLILILSKIIELDIKTESNGFYPAETHELYEVRTGRTHEMEDRESLNKALAQMLKGGVIMDVTTPEQAHIAEEAGACAVMALERIPADIRAAQGVARMSDPKMIKGIQEAVTIPVMAKCRIGHFVEAQILQAIDIDYIDESEVLSPADDVYHIDKTAFAVPFVCGARDLGEALRRIAEGASMIRTKGEPGTGDVVQAVRHMRAMQADIRRIAAMAEDELFEAAKQLGVSYGLVKEVHEKGSLPVVNFAAGGVATPADAALMMQLGAEGVFVGSGIFKSGDPAKRAAAIVKAVANYEDAERIAALSEDLGEAMVGINESEIAVLMAERGK